MKIFNLVFITFCLISYINSTCQPDEENNKIRDKDDCIKRTFSEDETSKSAYKCCYMKQKKDDYNFKGKEYSCITLTQNDYNNIKQVIKNLESSNVIKDVDIDCKKSYLKFSVFSLLLILL